VCSSDLLGLGLAVCYSIMKRHNGLISAASEPGHGTTFYLYLPAQPLV
jgi:two-component system cell cycle sensor histidine kinase/response regulator CckA